MFLRALLFPSLCDILMWVPGQAIQGNVEADRCARKEAEKALTGPELTFGIAYRMSRASISLWVSKKHQKHW